VPGAPLLFLNNNQRPWRNFFNMRGYKIAAVAHNHNHMFRLSGSGGFQHMSKK
jgi:hypothetical protein